MDNEVIKIAKSFKNKLDGIIPYRMVYLFGSQATGTADENSDIDIAVIVDKLGDDFLTLSGKMYEFVREIDLRLEPVLLEIENDRSGFAHKIINTGYRIDT